MNVTRRIVLAAAPAGAALATLGNGDPASAGASPMVSSAPAAPGQADWLVALRSGLARRGAP